VTRGAVIGSRPPSGAGHRALPRSGRLTMALLFDPEDPPEAPPKGSHPLIWRLAWTMWTEHQQDITGCCRASSCRARWQEWPCEQHHLAVAGLNAATGHRWINLNGTPGS